MKPDIKEIFRSFSKLKVLIIGDVMLDSYLWGKVERISPEAPVPIVSVDKKENRLGGAANVALNVQAMGASSILCSVIGDDNKAEIFCSLLKKQGLTSKGIIKSKERTTTVKTRVIGNKHQILRIDEEVENDITEKERQQLQNFIKRTLNTEKIDIIIFEDYDKGILTKELINQVIIEANKYNIPIAVDPKKKNFIHYKNITLLKPNLKELKEGLKLDLEYNDQEFLKKTVSNLQKKQNIHIALITLSESGIYLSNKSIKELIPAHVRDIVDVSGAGDTVISVAALCLALGLPPKLIAILANLAGGQVCEKLGAVPVDKDQLIKEASSLDLRKLLLKNS